MGSHSAQYNSPRMSILKVARLGHPVLRAKAKPIDPQRHHVAAHSKAHRRHDGDDERVSRHRAGRAAGAREPAGVRRRDRGGGSAAPARPKSCRSRSSTPRSRQSAAISSRTGRAVSASRTFAARCPATGASACAASIATARPLDIELEEFPARVVQHETDHLNGVLFFDRMKSFETLAFLEEYTKYWAKD